MSAPIDTQSLTKPWKFLRGCNNGGQKEAAVAIGVHRAVGGREAGGLSQDVGNGHRGVTHADPNNNNS